MKGKSYLRDHQDGMNYEEIALKYNTSYDAVRSAIRRYRQSLKDKGKEEEMPNEFITIDHSGTQTRSKIIEISPDDMEDYDVILRKFDLNPELWVLKSCSFSKWGREGDQRYSTRITAVPIEKSVPTLDEVFQTYIDGINKLKPFRHDEIPEKHKYSNNKCLVIPLFDLHFQAGDEEEDYGVPYFVNMRYLITRDFYEKIIIILGGDALEHDNFIYTTEEGTRTEDTDLVQDMLSLQKHLEDLIHLCVMRSKQVEFIYVRGNHSPSTDWAVTNALRTRFDGFDNVTFDMDEKTLLKGTTCEGVFIGAYHGHRTIKNGQHGSEFSIRFPYDWAKTGLKLIFTGHYHSEKETISDEGTCLVHRQPSPKPSNQWAENRNYISHFTGLKVYVIDYYGLQEIHYI